MQPSLFIFTIATIFLSCRRDNGNVGPKDVEIYLLKSYQTISSKCQIDPSLSVLQNTATIQNQDILAYSTTEYKFKLTDAAIDKVKAFKDRTPFAVTVDGQVIYYAFFKPGISSSSCDQSITMDIAGPSDNEIYLRLGYPSLLPGATIEDNRNHPKLIEALRRQGKLQ